MFVLFYQDSQYEPSHSAMDVVGVTADMQEAIAFLSRPVTGHESRSVYAVDLSDAFLEAGELTRALAASDRT